MSKNIATLTDYFIWKASESGDQITHLKLQKLLYYCQAWFLANCGKELFKEDFEAWVHGPVLRSVYDKFKTEKYKPWDSINKDINKEKLLKEISELSKEQGEDIFKFLEFIAEDYLGFTGFQLENMTHGERPWREARRGLAPDEISKNIITKKSMLHYYKKLIA